MKRETIVIIIKELAFLILDTLFLEALLIVEFRILLNLYFPITVK